MIKSWLKQFKHHKHDYEFLPAYLAVAQRPPAPLGRLFGYGVCASA